MSTLPIADYALLSDCHSAALVSRSGSIDWFCAPRFDSPSLFGRVLDELAGHWSIDVLDAKQTTRQYIDETMVLRTTIDARDGTLVLEEALVIGRNERGHQLALNSPGVLVRRLRCVRGFVEVAVEYAPRPEYGQIRPLIDQRNGAVTARGGAEVLLLSTPVELEIEASTARGRLHLSSGQRIGFALHRWSAWQSRVESWSQSEIDRRLDDTIEGWRTWSRLHQSYQGPWRDLVHHSGRVLQALTYRPTGAIVAAPTTSLPESIGGDRNWDYRYTWIRDASLTMQALWIAACPDEAHQFFSWMAFAAAAQQGQSDLQIMFGIGGEHDLSERELPHLRGWRQSSPVRVGNGAWNQRQLDVYGELLSAACLFKKDLGELDRATREFFVYCADAAAARWNEPDQGIWELRGAPRHFVHSKLMCWVALDRAIELVKPLQAQSRLQAWSSTREVLRETILTQGWSDEAHSFTQAFGSDELDASVLMMPMTGFISAQAPRMRATIDAIAERLTDGRGLVFRYRSHDGLAGDEGSFLLCTFWLAEALAMAGEVERARATFEGAIAYANDVGLLAEEVDARSGELLGNFPQAFSHIGLINAAWAISQAQGSSSGGAANPTRPQSIRASNFRRFVAIVWPRR